MALIGAILGDIAGSRYEFKNCWPARGIDYKNCELFTNRCVFTDDTVLSLATKMAVLKKISFESAYRELAGQYKYVGYGTGFHAWLVSDNPKPFNSCGNGSAMRISYLSEIYDDIEQTQKIAEKSAECTHNHPEGVKGAVVAVTCMWMAKHGASKEEIYSYACQQYSASEYKFGCEYPIDSYRKFYRFDATCQGSLPVAIRCFYESDDYESCLRNAFSLECDLDTVCSIAGGIAESYYKTTGFDDNKLFRCYLDSKLRKLLYAEGNDYE